MDKEFINNLITIPRLSTYQTFKQYEQNLLVSKQYYIPLALLEVTLRNSINNHLKNKYGNGWLINNAFFLRQDLIRKRDEAKYKLQTRKETITQDKLIAELSFGFWTSLFKAPYAKQMRKNDLKKIFKNLPPRHIIDINRASISSKLNNIRAFRNRIFHYEKIIDSPKYQNIDKDINQILNFLHTDLQSFSKRLNSVS